MKKSPFTETQIISVLKQSDAGVRAKDICWQTDISVVLQKWESKYGGLRRPSCGGSRN